MAPLKRKRPHDAIPESVSKPTVTRRATRQTSIPPLPIQADPEPRHYRRRADTVNKSEPGHRGESGAPGVGSSRVLQERRATQKPAKPVQQADPPKTTRSTRQGGGSTNGVVAPSAPRSENVEPAATASSQPTAPAQPASRRRQTIAPLPPIAPMAQGLAPQPAVSRPIQKPFALTSTGPSQVPLPQQPARQPQEKPREAAQSDRNIDKVVLGEICFKAWYPSYYGKEVLGDISGNSTKGGNTNGTKGGSKEEAGGKANHRKDRDNQPMLDRLYVCPCCFKYSKEIVPWWEHVRVCETREYVPGNRVYVHPKGRRIVRVPDTSAPRSTKKKGRDSGLKSVEEVVEDRGEWSIWEVDGEKEGVSEITLPATPLILTGHSSSARICRFLPSFSSTISRFSLMSLASITFCSCTLYHHLSLLQQPTARGGSAPGIKLSDFSRRRKCHGTTIISPAF